MRDKLRVTEQMLEALLKAIRKTAKPGAKVDAARVGTHLIHDGTYHGVLNIDTRCSAFVSLLNWCQAEEDELGDVALEIIDQITDEDRAHSPAVMAAIGSVFCSGTRSPYQHPYASLGSAPRPFYCVCYCMLNATCKAIERGTEMSRVIY